MSESNKPSLKPVPDPEVSDRPKRRSFTAEYKLNILRELDAITEPGQVGEVLRREGLYSSHISDWRRLRALGELQALEAKKTGRPKKEHNPLEARLAEAERKAARLESVALNTTDTARYIYDAAGQRLAKVVDKGQFRHTTLTIWGIEDV